MLLKRIQVSSLCKMNFTEGNILKSQWISKKWLFKFRLLSHSTFSHLTSSCTWLDWIKDHTNSAVYGINIMHEEFYKYEHNAIGITHTNGNYLIMVDIVHLSVDAFAEKIQNRGWMARRRRFGNIWKFPILLRHALNGERTTWVIFTCFMWLSKFNKYFKMFNLLCYYITVITLADEGTRNSTRKSNKVKQVL